MSRIISKREQFADIIYQILILISSSMFIIVGLIGYVLYDVWGVIIGVISGFLIGIWMQHSFGKRGKDSFTGFYVRMRERAKGSPPGLLERFLESVRGNAFTVDKCSRIIQVFDSSMEKLKQTNSPEERERILIDLSETTKKISYEKTNGK